MNEKRDRIASVVDRCRGRDLDAHYLGFFECFNQDLFYEAHEVLEKLWLPNRKGPNDSFYKGLIQLAGAFVHLQKERPQPCASLLKLARSNLQKYSSPHDHLDVGEVLQLIETWLRRVEAADDGKDVLTNANAPKLRLLEQK